MCLQVFRDGPCVKHVTLDELSSKFLVPPQAWNCNNLRKIGETWGDVVCFDKATEEGFSFQSAKLLLDTRLWPQIEEELLLTLNDGRFRIFVREISVAFLDSGAFSTP